MSELHYMILSILMHSDKPLSARDIAFRLEGTSFGQVKSSAVGSALVSLKRNGRASNRKVRSDHPILVRGMQVYPTYSIWSHVEPAQGRLL